MDANDDGLKVTDMCPVVSSDLTRHDTSVKGESERSYFNPIVCFFNERKQIFKCLPKEKLFIIAYVLSFEIFIF